MKRTLLYWLLIIGLIAICLLSCRTAQHHFDKFQKKGGKINCVADTVSVIDTLIFEGDTIIFVRPEIVVKDSIHYLTRYEVKYKYKTVKAKEKTAQVEIKTDGKNTRNEAKQKGKTDRQELKGVQPWKVWLIGIGLFVLGVVVGWILSVIIGVFRNMPLINR